MAERPLAAPRSWASYQSTYRGRELKRLVGWIEADVSGSVVGMGGAGKSNLLGFLCQRPDAVQTYLSPRDGPLAVVLVDLNNLPSNSLDTFHRVLIRAFYEARERFDTPLQQVVVDTYLENRAVTDPFVTQSALRDLLLGLQAQGARVVLVMDRFDMFCESATPQLTDTLRGLRDSFKGTLSYIVGMRQEIAYLSDHAVLGELYEILDTQVCWVGPMNETDARQMIAEEMGRAASPPAERDVVHLLALTGGYPALLKAACHWWLSQSAELPRAEWQAALLAETGIRYRLEEIWGGLTQAEQLVLGEVHALQARVEALMEREGTDPAQVKRAIDKAHRDLEKQHRQALNRLADKGICLPAEGGWRIFSDLLADYIADAAGRGRGTIWRDEKSGELFQGQGPIADLPNLERRALDYLIDRPRIRHTKTALIEGIWPDESVTEGVMDDALYQVIKELRRKIEPTPSKPCYIVTWRGKPEGGYQFFPEGRPGSLA